jgi:hypothetical protein
MFIFSELCWVVKGIKPSIGDVATSVIFGMLREMVIEPSLNQFFEIFWGLVEPQLAAHIQSANRLTGKRIAEREHFIEKPYKNLVGGYGFAVSLTRGKITFLRGKYLKKGALAARTVLASCHGSADGSINWVLATVPSFYNKEIAKT